MMNFELPHHSNPVNLHEDLLALKLARTQSSPKLEMLAALLKGSAGTGHLACGVGRGLSRLFRRV